MTTRRLQLLEAHIRSFDPDTPTARERVEAALGEQMTAELLRILKPTRVSARGVPTTFASDGRRRW